MKARYHKAFNFHTNKEFQLTTS